MDLKTIDWNKASELGLIARINKEILHPLGLAMTRNPETGASESLLIANDLIWEYSSTMNINVVSDEEIRKQLSDINKNT